MSQEAINKMTASSQNVMKTKKELQESWQQLELKPATLLHLQEVLDTAGITAAVTVTDVIMLEKMKRVRFTTLGKEWGSETLRLLSLEGMRPHIIDVLRVLLESFLAWHLISLPAGGLDHIVEITLAALFLLMSLIGICLVCRFRTRSSGKKQRKSS